MRSRPEPLSVALRVIAIGLVLCQPLQPPVQAIVVVGQDLIDPSGQVVERIAVRRQDARHRKRAHRTQGIEKVAERIVPRVGIEPDVRGNPRQDVIAREKDTLGLVD